MTSSRLLVPLSVLGVLAAASCNVTVDPIGGGPTTGTGGIETTSYGVAVGGSSQGGNGQGGAGGFGAGGGNPTAAGGAGPTSIALYQSEITGGGEGGFGTSVVAVSGVGGSDSGAGGASETTSGSSGAGGAFPDGEPLLLVIGSSPSECTDPFASGTTCADSGVHAYIWLPPEYQAAGEVHSLSDPAISAWFSEWESEGSECMSTGSSFEVGAIEITAVDEASFTVELSGTASSLNGLHPVARCTPIVEDTYSVLAYFPSDLPDPSGAGGASSATSVSGAGGSGDERFVIDFGNRDRTCADPSPEPGPGQTFQSLKVYIPDAYLDTPGAHPLSDSQISVSYTEQSSDSGSAVGTGGSGEPGTLTIFEVTPSYIDLQLEGTSYDFANGGGQVPRCGG